MLLIPVKKDIDPLPGTLFDGTRVKIESHKQPQQTVRPFLTCSGLGCSTGEIIVAFAWLASTLRQASGDETMYSVARVAQVQPPSRRQVNYKLILSEEPFISEDDTELILLEEPFISKDDTGIDSIGGCWQTLFNNPVISKGFPVPVRPPGPVRPSGTPSLEISLEAMGILVGASRLTIFNNRAVMKGFNAAIFATACTDDTVFWHLHVNRDGSRIRYSDKMVMESLPVEMPSAISSLQGKRHFLGWAPDVSYNIGENFAFATWINCTPL